MMKKKRKKYSKVRAIIAEMLLKAIPKHIAAGAAQKRRNDPIKVMLLIMIKYQPGSRREKEAKGKIGKDGKNNDGKGKSEKDGKGRGKVEPCYFLTETDEGCNKGQQRTRYHRMLKPDEKKCYVCGSTRRVANECDKPKRKSQQAREFQKAIKESLTKEKPKEN